MDKNQVDSVVYGDKQMDRQINRHQGRTKGEANGAEPPYKFWDT